MDDTHDGGQGDRSPRPAVARAGGAHVRMRLPSQLSSSSPTWPLVANVVGVAEDVLFKLGGDADGVDQWFRIWGCREGHMPPCASLDGHGARV
jgi:hypothetical protein